MQGNCFTEIAPTEEAISLSDLSAELGAHITVCSSPELSRDEKKNYMRIIEQLPNHLRTSSRYAVTSIVDFSGSTSGDLCKSKIRSIEGGKAITHEDDFKRDLTGIEEYRKYFDDHKEDFKNKAMQTPSDDKKTAEQLAKEGFAIKNSQWNSFWRGKVAGGLSMALTMTGGKPITDDMLKKLKIGRLQKGKSDLRAVIAVMIDGGPVTQQEQREMPQICDEVIFDLRRQGYDWASNAHVLLVRFPDVETMLQSLDGKPNLCRSKRLGRKQRDEFHLVRIGMHNLAWEYEASPRTKEAGSSLFNSTWFSKVDWKEALKYDATYSAMNLYQSVACGDVAGTKRLLMQEVRITEAESDGRTALHACAATGDSEIMEMLLKGFKVKDKKDKEKEYKQFKNDDERKRYVNKKDYDGIIPLHYAGSEEVAKLLIESKAEVNEKNKWGDTPLHFARTEGIAKLLLASKAELNSKNKKGQTPLHLAKTEGVAKLLIESKAAVNSKDKNGYTPRYYAEYLCRAEVIKVLREAQ